MRRATSAAAWYERGCALEATDAAAALHAYDRAVAGQPAHADAHNNRGRVLHDRGELAAAQAAYVRALRIDPRVALYWFNLGVVVEDRGSIGAAMLAYRAALARDPNLADAHFNLARVLERLGRGAGIRGAERLRRAVRHLATYRKLARR
jgi:tetratricopeptide (TPR) repeat protein